MTREDTLAVSGTGSAIAYTSFPWETRFTEMKVPLVLFCFVFLELSTCSLALLRDGDVQPPRQQHPGTALSVDARLQSWSLRALPKTPLSRSPGRVTCS